MPFVVKPYDKYRKQKIGDVVFLPSRPDIPMIVTGLPTCNVAAGHKQRVNTAWIGLDGKQNRGEWFALELSL